MNIYEELKFHNVPVVSIEKVEYIHIEDAKTLVEWANAEFKNRVVADTQRDLYREASDVYKKLLTAFGEAFDELDNAEEKSEEVEEILARAFAAIGEVQVIVNEMNARFDTPQGETK